MPSISRAAWRRPTSDDEAARRAAGRARYNAWRRFQRTIRRRLVMDLLAAGLSTREIAEAVGAAPRTVRQDVAALLDGADKVNCCPLCGSGPFEALAHGRPLPWREPGAKAALRNAAAFRRGDSAAALAHLLPVDPDDLENLPDDYA